jgi:hypothetical protein
MSTERFRVVWTEPSTAPVDDSVIERRIGEHVVRVHLTESLRRDEQRRYNTDWYLFIEGDTPEWPVCWGYRFGDAAARLQVERALRWYGNDPRRLTAHKIPPGALPPPAMPKESHA